MPATPTWNWAAMLEHWVPGDPYQPEPGAEEYYRVKHAIARYTEAQSICEIGVRAGYSAAAFLSAGYARQYIGFDLDMGTDGGVRGYMVHARATLLRAFPQVTGVIARANSQCFTPAELGCHDLVHVDGDHSYFGAYLDVDNALKSGSQFILVDDVDMMPDVSSATMNALAANGSPQAWYVSDGGYRGNVLIQTR